MARKLHEHVRSQQPARSPCPIAFIEEAPGDSETVHGVPLCGPKGKLFDRLLHQAGIKREDCLITHVFDRQLAGDKLKNECTKEPTFEGAIPYKGMGYLPPDTSDQLARLKEELVAADPAVIVPLGGLSLWAVTGRSDITSSRGTLTRATLLLPGRRTLPTFRPGMIFMQYKMRGTMVNDLKKALAAAKSASGLIVRPKRELWLSPTLTDMTNFLPSLQASPLISCDIETERGQITKVGLAASKSLAIVVPFVSPVAADHSYWSSLNEEMLAWDWLRGVADTQTAKIFQNGGYDNWHFLRHDVPFRNWRHDLRLLHHALYPELPKSLAYMGSVYTFERAWKIWGHTQAEKRDA